jgi:hypothetical protein
VDPTHNRRHIARSLGMLFLIEGTLGQIWLLLPHDAGQPLPLVAICVLAQVLGIWMRRGGLDFAPLWDDLNTQARAWCEQRNQQIHHTTHQRPLERWLKEGLQPLPHGFAWARFATEERKVSWDGYLSYDGVLYGLPSEPPVAGSTVQVRAQPFARRLVEGAHIVGLLTAGVGPAFLAISRRLYVMGQGRIVFEGKGTPGDTTKVLRVEKDLMEDGIP